MSPNFRRTAAVLGAGCFLVASPLRAQFTVGANAGEVRYEQVPSTSSFVLNPDLTLTGGRRVINLSGTATAASDGTRALQAGGTVWGATAPVLAHLQLDGMLQGSYTSPNGDSASTSYSVFAFGEGAFTGDDYGFALGVGGLRGGIAGQAAVNAVRASARGWKGVGPVTIALALQPTALSTRVWFTDVAANAEWDPGNSEISGTLLVRQSPATGLGLGGEGSFTYHLNRRVAFAASAGQYLRDPFQGLPQGFHVNAGVVLTLWRPAALESEGVGKADLTDVELKALGLNLHGLGHSAVRLNPATSKKLVSGSGATGRSHKP